MPQRRLARALILRTLGGVAVAAIATGCAGTAAAPARTDGPAWTESGTGHPLPGPVTVFTSAQAAVVNEAAQTAGGDPPAAAAQTAQTAPAAGLASAPADPVVHLDLTIVTDAATGRPGYPAYVPSSFELPAHATVVITVTNFDTATALPNGSERYAKVRGTLGDVATVTPIHSSNPNGSAGAARSISALSPAAVSHTFTILALGINVPIAPQARETFIIHTGAPGTYDWRCFDPCGAGSVGWGGAMAAPGYMEGTLTVVG